MGGAGDGLQGVMSPYPSAPILFRDEITGHVMHKNDLLATIGEAELIEIAQAHRARKVRGEAVALFNVFGRTLAVEGVEAGWLLPEVEGLESDPALVYPIYMELCRAADIQERQWVRNEERLRGRYAPASKRTRGKTETTRQIGEKLREAEARLERGGLDWCGIYRGVLASWLVENSETGLGGLSTADNLRDTWLAGKGCMGGSTLDKRRASREQKDENVAALQKAWRAGADIRSNQIVSARPRKQV